MVGIHYFWTRGILGSQIYFLIPNLNLANKIHVTYIRTGKLKYILVVLSIHAVCQDGSLPLGPPQAG